MNNTERNTDYDDDSGVWDGFHAAKKASRERKRNAMYNISEKLRILDRVEFVNEGTCLLDGKFYYYAQKKKARVKGQSLYFQMRGFQHFIDVFCKPISPSPPTLLYDSPTLDEPQD